MKLILKIALMLCVAVATQYQTIAQKGGNFEGTIVYEISFPDIELDDASKAMLPTKMTMQFKDNLSRMEMKMGMGMSTTTLSDSKAKTATTLIDAMGNKMAMKVDEAELNAQQKNSTESIKVEKTGDKKTIAGYECEKVKVFMKGDKGEEVETEVYYTEAIKVPESNWNNPQFKNINGMMMQFEMNQGQMNMRMIAKSVKAEKLNKELFVVPTDYKMMTREQMMKMMGGM